MTADTTNEQAVEHFKQEILERGRLDVTQQEIVNKVKQNHLQLSDEQLREQYVIAQLRLLDYAKKYLFEVYRWVNVELKRQFGNEANTGPFDHKVANGQVVQTTIYVYLLGHRIADLTFHYPQSSQQTQPYVFFVSNTKNETQQAIKQVAQQGFEQANEVFNSDQ